MNHNSLRTSSSSLTRALIAALLLLILAAGASAQEDSSTRTDSSTPIGLAPGSPAGSYPLSDFETVNPFNGGLNFRLPLVNIGGRGGTGYSLPLHIEQKWSISRQPNPGDPATYNAQSGWWSEDLGTARTLNVGRLQVRRGGSENFVGPDCLDYRYTKTVTRITFTAPDGTEYELRDQLTGGEPAEPAACSTGFNRGKVFVTADGTSATYVSAVDIIDAYSFSEAGEDPVRNSGDLMLRDGTHFHIVNGSVRWMRDRNGNKVTFEYDAGFERLTKIIDSLNREIRIVYGTQTTTYYDEIKFIGFGGTERTIKIGHCLRSDAMRSDLVGTNPSFPGVTSIEGPNPPVINYIELPDGRRYQIQYNAYAEIARVELPTGGAIEYEWENGIDGGDASGIFDSSPPRNKYVYRRVVERRLHPDGSTGPNNYESKMTYSKPESFTTNEGFVRVDQYDSPSSNTLLARSLHYFHGSAIASFLQKGTDYPAWQDGREYRTEIFDTTPSTPTLLRTVESIFEQRDAVSWWTGTSAAEPPNDVRLAETITTLEDSSQVSNQVFGYDDSVPFNNRNNVKEYDFGGTLLRETRTTYLTDTSYVDDTDVHIRNLPRTIEIYNGSNQRQAQTDFEYDNYAQEGSDCAHSFHCPPLERSHIIGFDSSFGTSYEKRGNVTATTRYLLTGGSVPTCSSAPSQCLTSYSQFDIAGNVVRSIDPRSTSSNIIATTLDYDDNFGDPDNEARINSEPPELAGGSNTFALPTKVTNALGHTAHSQYDYYLSRSVNAEDANGVIASGAYNDPLDRPTQVRQAIDTGDESQSTFTYDDAARIITTTSDFAATDDNALMSKLFYDKLGRTIETRQYESGTNYIAVQTQYDVLGRAFKTSNPFRPWLSETAMWSTTEFDALGRVKKVTTPDNAYVSTDYDGSRVLVTDQALKQRLSESNALGQLKHVWEITAEDSETEEVSFPDHSEVTHGYHTIYSYDTLDGLINVTQGLLLARTFTYDSLKRLTSAFNPESGTVDYVYDKAGNLTEKTDDRPVTTAIAYDALNRPTSKAYNDSPKTPTVTYLYDSETLPNGAPSYNHGYTTGRLLATIYGLSLSANSGNYYGYDALGRPTIKVQRTDGVNYGSSATYNVRAMTAEKYPKNINSASDQREVSYSYDAAGRLEAASSAAPSYSYGAGIGAMSYAAHGGLASETYDNNVVHAITYNNRLQANEIKLGTSGSPTSLLDLTYNYGTTANNGNVQSIGYSGGGLSYTQSFGYDALNRLTTSSETPSSGTSWSQTNGYDRYGNRWIDLGGGSQSLTFSTSTNRISGASYDAAGNLLNDGTHSYTYDAENRIRKVDGTLAYEYNGEGQRVRKLVGENTRFVYNLNGNLIMELSGTNGSLLKEYLHAGDSVATIEPTAKENNAVRYLTSDTLGSPRVITKPDGSVLARHDYKPFGEEIFAGTGGRTTGQGYSVTDGVRQKFTSKERDIETGLDFFEARYYASTQGRFTSPDEFTGGPEELYHFADDASANPTFYSDLRKPQSLNKYQYAYNNPLRWIDPDGHEPDDPKKQEKPEVIVIKTVDPKIISLDVKLIDKVPDTGEVPVGGQFEIKYKYVINEPTDGSNPGDAGTIAPITPKGTFTESNQVGLVDSTTKVDKGKEAVVVEKTERFVVKERPESKPGATAAINFKVVVKDPNTGKVVERRSTQGRGDKYVPVRNVPKEPRKNRN